MTRRRPSFASEVARQVVALLRAEGVLSAPCRDNETIAPESSGRPGYRADRDGESQSSRRQKAMSDAEALLDGLTIKALPMKSRKNSQQG